MPRTQSIVLHIASMANKQMSLSHSRHLQCYLKIRYIRGALRSGYARMRNAQCNNSEDNLFLIKSVYMLSAQLIDRGGFRNFRKGGRKPNSRKRALECDFSVPLSVIFL